MLFNCVFAAGVDLVDHEIKVIMRSLLIGASIAPQVESRDFGLVRLQCELRVNFIARVYPYAHGAEIWAV